MFIFAENKQLNNKRNVMPEISRFYGIVITMFFSEHNPPHFHVRYMEHRALIDIANGTITGSLPLD